MLVRRRITHLVMLKHRRPRGGRRRLVRGHPRGQDPAHLRGTRGTQSCGLPPPTGVYASSASSAALACPCPAGMRATKVPTVAPVCLGHVEVCSTTAASPPGSIPSSGSLVCHARLLLSRTLWTLPPPSARIGLSCLGSSVYSLSSFDPRGSIPRAKIMHTKLDHLQRLSHFSCVSLIHSRI